jgi:hypothetical protein
MSDLISRQAVIEWLKDKDIIKTKNQEENAKRELAELPYTQPNLQPTCNQLATDCISRQAALEVLDDYAEDIESGNLGIAYSKARMSMCAAPSVEPERKHGHWIMQNDRSKKLLGWSFCSECNAWIGEPTDYCSCCGADMREGQNE